MRSCVAGFLNFARMTNSSLLQKERLSLAYFAMRLGIFCMIGLLLGVDVTSSETQKPAKPSPSPYPTLPDFRPSLIGPAATALLNTYDTFDLIKQRTNHADSCFYCLF